MNDQSDNFIDPRTKASRYVRVYTALREWIKSGRYMPGSKIASEQEIGQMFGVSRITTRKAIDLLVEDELVYRMHGKGTYVSENAPQRANIANMAKRIRAARRVAGRSKIENFEVSDVDADLRTTADLKLSKGSRVKKISYVRVFSGTRICYVESYIPTTLGVNVEQSDLTHTTTLSMLEEQGIHIDSATEVISATLADASVAQHLESNVGIPLLRIKQVVADLEERPVERFIVYYRADQYEHPAIVHDRKDLDLVHGAAPASR